LRQCIAYLLPSSEKREPNAAKDQHGKAGANYQKHQHRWAGFRLARLYRGFDDYTVFFGCHDVLLDFRGKIGPIKYRSFLDIVRRCTRRCIFGSVS
jgi:hypothetical protein